MNDPSKEIWYYLEISKKKNINLRKLNEENSSAYKTTNRVIKKKGKGTLTFQICKLEEKMKKTKKDCKIRANSYDCWGIIIEKIKDSPNFYLNQRFFFDYLQDYIAKELKYYRKFEKIVKIVNNLEIQRKIERTPEELKLVQQEIEEVFSIDQKRELNNIFCQDDTFEVVDNQNIIHTYELN